MSALEIGQKLVAAVAGGREVETAFVKDWYSDKIVSVEGQDSSPISAQIEGIDAVLGKHEWWYGNNEIHGVTAEGPFVGFRQDQFVIRFGMDITPNGGERMTMDEVGLFTVADNKIVKEEYLYLMG